LFFVTSATLSSPYLLLSLVESLLVASTKTQQQQKTNNKDTDQASGGKPKEQSSTAKTKNGGVVIYKVGTDNIITEALSFTLLVSPCITNEPSLFFVTSATLSSPYLLLSLVESLLVASVMILSVPTL
jgi:hypothetical protein